MLQRIATTLAATTTAIASIFVCGFIGYSFDRYLHHEFYWLGLFGALVGLGLGFYELVRKLRRDA